ncbi:MAG: SRPBCC domain-containing protein [Ferruginibacter sp.]
MNSTLQFDFSVDKENKCINVKRAFAAPPEDVWAAWTEAELLDQWWAPKPYKAVTKKMDFSVGGSWLYAMTGPDNFEHHCRADYQSINPGKSFSAEDAFCDAEGNINHSFPRSTWTNTFSKQGEDQTLVNISIQYKQLEDLEKIIEMGFKEGFSMGLSNLDELLAARK